MIRQIYIFQKYGLSNSRFVEWLYVNHDFGKNVIWWIMKSVNVDSMSRDLAYFHSIDSNIYGLCLYLYSIQNFIPLASKLREERYLDWIVNYQIFSRFYGRLHSFNSQESS